MDNTLIVLSIINGVLGFSVLGYAVWCALFDRRWNQRNPVLLLILGFTLVCLGITLGMTYKKRVAFFKAVDSGFTIYVNGQEVEAEHLDLDAIALRATVNTDDRVILVTLKG